MSGAEGALLDLLAALLVRREGRADSRRYAIQRFGPERHASAVLRVYQDAIDRAPPDSGRDPETSA